jgi:class 3 adenylate cyclase
MSQVENETVSRQVEGYDLLIATEVSRRGGQVIRSIEPGYLLAFNQQSAALKCAEQIRTKFKKQFNSDFALRIAIDRGDVWRLIRAHGTEYCGPTVTSCRELLKETQDGEIATTESFARSLAREDRELGARMRQQIERTFKFDGISQPIWALSC